MRKPLALGLLAALSLLLFVAAPAVSKRKSVEVDDNYFVHRGDPRTITVKRGDRVEWEWEGVNPHNVTVRRGPVRFHSRTKASGKYVKTMRRRGTYRILCTVHAPTMRMRLKVQ
jgi:plastocyanin